MLSLLKVKDFAIIDELELDFSGGFNVLTGETGAGKSILVDALGLVLGDKAHGEMVRTGREEARIEAVFGGLAGSWPAYLESRGLAAEDDGSLFLQRRISKGGKHQAHLNGSAVPLGVLAEAGGRLVDIHGQHQHQTLLKVHNQLDILDEFGGLTGRRREFAELAARLGELEGKIRRLADDRRAREQEKDFLAFQLREIESAGLAPGEDGELEQTRTLMVNAEKISLLAGEALERIYEGEGAAIGQIETAAARMEELSRIIPEAAATAREVKGCDAVLREAACSLQEMVGRAQYDAEEHNRVEERLALIGRLKKKYGATVDEIMKRGEAIKAQLALLGDADGMCQEWVKEKETVLARMAETGGRLSREREAAGRRLEKDVMANLAELGMEKARFQVRLTPRTRPDGILATPQGRYEPSPAGLEDVEFLLSANPGEEPKSLARVASGGELSRIMLAVKTSLAAVDPVDTLIFDEIDAGIGGAVARVVGRKLRSLAAERQVICVTHLPQIASLAQSHFLVQKQSGRGKTKVTARRLEPDERVNEVARMIAGEEITRTATQHARELMEG